MAPSLQVKTPRASLQMLSNLGDLQFLFIDLAIILVLVFTSECHPGSPQKGALLLAHQEAWEPPGHVAVSGGGLGEILWVGSRPRSLPPLLLLLTMG